MTFVFLFQSYTHMCTDSHLCVGENTNSDSNSFCLMYVLKILFYCITVMAIPRKDLFGL